MGPAACSLSNQMFYYFWTKRRCFVVTPQDCDRTIPDIPSPLFLWMIYIELNELVSPPSVKQSKGKSNRVKEEWAMEFPRMRMTIPLLLNPNPRASLDWSRSCISIAVTIITNMAVPPYLTNSMPPRISPALLSLLLSAYYSFYPFSFPFSVRMFSFLVFPS